MNWDSAGKLRCIIALPIVDRDIYKQVLYKLQIMIKVIAANIF